MNPLENASKLTKCPKCYRLLCKRISTPAGYLVEVKHKGITVIAANATIMCPSCGTAATITGQNGIEEVFKQ